VRAKGRSLEDGGIPLRPPSASPLPVGPLQPQANLVSANDGLCREMRASQGRDVSLVTLAGCRKSKMAALDPRDVPRVGGWGERGGDAVVFDSTLSSDSANEETLASSDFFI